MSMYITISLAIAEVLIFMLLAGGFFAFKSIPLRKSVLACFCFGLLRIALVVLNGNLGIQMLFWLVAGTFLLVFLYDARLAPAIFASIAYVVLFLLMRLATLRLYSYWNLLDQSLMPQRGSDVLYRFLIQFALLAAVAIVRFTEGVGSGKLSFRALLPVCPTIMLGMAVCVQLTVDVRSNETITHIHPWLLLLLLFTSLIMLGYVLWQGQREVQYSAEIVSHHYAMQREYYEQFHSQQEQTRALWHDISKYIRAVEAEGATGPSFTELQEMVKAITPVVDVNNRVISVILNEYVQMATEAEALLELDVQVPPELAVTAADLYILLGNTLDNALDACIELPVEERVINLQLRMHNQMLFYKITNPYLQAHLSKRRGSFHGYGLKNVQECVRRNNGTIEISKNDGKYTVTALINCI